MYRNASIVVVTVCSINVISHFNKQSWEVIGGIECCGQAPDISRIDLSRSTYDSIQSSANSDDMRVEISTAVIILPVIASHIK